MEGDAHVDDLNVSEDQEPYYDDLVELTPSEPPVKLELRRSTIEHQVSQRYIPHEYMMITDNREKNITKRSFQMLIKKSD